MSLFPAPAPNFNFKPFHWHRIGRPIMISDRYGYWSNPKRGSCYDGFGTLAVDVDAASLVAGE